MNAQAIFNATIELAGKTATGIPVPPDAVSALGSGKQPPVRVTIGDGTYRSTVAVRSGEFKIPLSAENRAIVGVGAGDHVKVLLELDTEPREVAIPSDLAEAFKHDPAAAAFFDELTHSQKQWYVLPIEEAKKPETRERRVAKAIGMLRERRKR